MPRSVSEWERVYTVTDYWDGPRAGVADFGGVPHIYVAIFNQELGEWDPEDRYELSPLPPNLLSAVQEDWAIWRRYELALKTGRIPIPESEEKWGALSEDRPRRAELRRKLAGALVIDPSRRTVLRGEFRPVLSTAAPPPLGVMKELEVRWADSAPATDLD